MDMIQLTKMFRMLRYLTRGSLDERVRDDRDERGKEGGKGNTECPTSRFSEIRVPREHYLRLVYSQPSAENEVTVDSRNKD